MGGDHEVGGAPQRGAGGQRLGVEDVQDRAGEMPAAEVGGERLVIHRRRPSDVHHPCAPLHEGLPAGVEQVAGLGRERRREEHEVRAREQRIELPRGMHLVHRIEGAAVPAHAEHPHAEGPAAPRDRGADAAGADHQHRPAPDRGRVQRLPTCPPLVAHDGGEAVVEHQHRHEPVLARLVRVRAAVVGDGDPGRHPVHGAQVLHPSADDVDQAQVGRDLGQVRGREIPGHQHLGGAHRALEVVEVPVDEHVEMPRDMGIPGRGGLEAFAGDGEHRLAFRRRRKGLRGGVVVLDVDAQGPARCHGRRGMRAGGPALGSAGNPRSAHGPSPPAASSARSRSVTNATRSGSGRASASNCICMKAWASRLKRSDSSPSPSPSRGSASTESPP